MFNNPLNRVMEFNNLFSGFQTVSKFPHYNIIQQTDGETYIEFALAGYSKDDIDIEVKDENTLVVSSRGVDKRDDVKYTHRGIAKRSFSIAFTLGKSTEVVEAEMSNGILSIHLKKIVAQEKLSKRIAIN
jgi:molecular chaperone IbpA